MMGSPVGREPPIPLTRASILKPFMSFLRGLGAPVAREILKADLPQWGFEDYDVLVPTRALTAFVANAGRSQSIDNFGLRMSRRCGMQGLEPGLRSAICSAPTLYAGLNQLCAGARHRSTRVNVWLKHDHDRVSMPSRQLPDRRNRPNSRCPGGLSVFLLRSCAFFSARAGVPSVWASHRTAMPAPCLVSSLPTPSSPLADRRTREPAGSPFHATSSPHHPKSARVASPPFTSPVTPSSTRSIRSDDSSGGTCQAVRLPSNRPRRLPTPAGAPCNDTWLTMGPPIPGWWRRCDSSSLETCCETPTCGPATWPARPATAMPPISPARSGVSSA